MHTQWTRMQLVLPDPIQSNASAAPLCCSQWQVVVEWLILSSCARGGAPMMQG